MPLALTSRAIKAAALVGSGFASFTRKRRKSEVTILGFHGLCEDVGDPGILDWTLHLPVEAFRSICALLAADYRVISMADLVEARARGTDLPDNSVIITFDDGYASNYELAYPILKKLDLHATFFVTTGFIDGDDMLWFQRVDLALSRSPKELLEWNINGRKLQLPLGTREQRQQSLMLLMPELKELSDADLIGEVNRLERELEVAAPTREDLPKPMRPMDWTMVREMAQGAHADIGGHTHTHPILSRCDSVAMRAEIVTCRDRIHEETGNLPAFFAYPNGGPEDYTHESMLLMRQAGFKAACNATHGRVAPDHSIFELPRYGSPESVWEAEATVSGAFETLKDWRQSCLKAMSMI